MIDEYLEENYNYISALKLNYTFLSKGLISILNLSFSIKDIIFKI